MGVLSKWKLLIVIKHIEPRLNNLNVVEKFIESQNMVAYISVWGEKIDFMKNKVYISPYEKCKENDPIINK